MAAASSLHSTNGTRASSPGAAVAWGECELSAVTLPTAMGQAPHGEQLHLKLECRPCRKVVTTRVFTVPSQQAAPVRLWSPRRPSTEKRSRRRRVCAQQSAAGKQTRARSAVARNSHPARPHVQPRPNTAGNPLEARLAKSAPETQRCQLVGDPSPPLVINSRTEDVHEDHWGLHPSSFCFNQEDVGTKRGEPRCPHAKQPRAMSASARGLAIRRAIDSCCKNLPATPRFATGATRLLQQWDRATRTQREELLRMLADRLLLAGRSHRCHKRESSGQHVDFHRDLGSQWIDGGEMAGWFPPLEPQGASHPPHASLGPDNVCPPGLRGNGGSHQSGFGYSNHHPKGLPSGVFPVGAVALTGSVVNDAKAETSPYHGNAEAAASKTVGTSDVVGFLELLGPHAGLLATRVSLQLRTSYAGGHVVGPCLRVCTLLAESTTGQGVTGDVDGAGYNMHSASGPNLLGQQLCTPEVLSTALEIAAAPPWAGIVVGDSNLKTNREKKARRRQKQERTNTTPTSSKDHEEEEEEEEEEHDRREALRLLLALVCVGGRRVKEYLTCPGRFFSPRMTDITAAPTLGSGDAFDRIVVALRRPTCSSDVRTAGACLLVELGSENHPHPPGNSRGRVWNAVLCLLSGLGDEDPADGHILGCRIAFDLLAASSSNSQGNHGGGRGPGSDTLVEGSISNRHQRQQRRRGLMRPELILLPSVLNLSLSDRCEVREAAGKLAVLLVTDFPRPCCYLLVACLVGLFGLVSGVDRGAPVAWIERTQPRPRWMQGGDVQNQTAADRSEMDEPGHEHELEEGVRKLSNNAVHSQNLSVGNHVFHGQPSGVEGTKEDSFAHSADSSSSGASGGRSTKMPASGFGSPAQTAPDNNSTASHGDKAIPALDLLRRICTEGGAEHDKSMRFALAHALAPLAALDLVVGRARPVVDSSSSDAGDTLNTKEGINGTVLVTQTEVKAAKSVAAGCSDGEETDAGGDSPRLQLEQDMLQSRGKGRLRGGGPQSVYLRDEVLRGCLGGERRLAGRQRCDCAQPSEEVCLAVSETLLAMYRGGRCGGAADGAGQPDTLDVDGMIDAALDSCPALSGSLRDGDSEAMTRIFSSCCSTSRGGGDNGDGTSVELRTLQQNIISLTARLGRVRPPPPSPSPPCAAVAAASRRGAGRDRPGVPHHNSSEDCQGGAGGRRAETFPKNEWYANATETSFLEGFSDRGDDGWRASTGREAIFSGEGARDWTEPGAEVVNLPHSRAAGGGDHQGHPLGTQPAAALLRQRREHQQRRQQQRPRGPTVVAVTSRRAAEVAGTPAASRAAARKPGGGARLWGPEDWEDSPTMAMLTEPSARQGGNPPREEGERPGPIWRAAFGEERSSPSTAAEVRVRPLTDDTAAKSSGDQGGKQRFDTDTTIAAGETSGGGSSPRRDVAAAPTRRTTMTKSPQDHAAVAPRRNDGAAAEAAAAGQRRKHRGGSNDSAVGKRAGSQQQVREAETNSPGSLGEEEKRPARARLTCGARRPNTAVAKATPTRQRPASSPYVYARAASKRKVPHRQRKGPGREGREGRSKGERRWVSHEGVASPEISPLLSLLRLSSVAIPPSRKQPSDTGTGGNIGRDNSNNVDNVGNRPRDEGSARRPDTWEGNARIPEWGTGGRWCSASGTTAAATPALQTTRIVKGAFQAAERCATTAIGR